MASFIRPDKDAASFQRRPEREKNSSVPEKEGKERGEERILGLVRRDTHRERCQCVACKAGQEVMVIM